MLDDFLASMGDDDSLGDLTMATVPSKSTTDDGSDLFDGTTPDKRQLIRSGLLTIHPPSTHPSWLQPGTYFPNADDILEQWCAKFERGEVEGTLHLHAYFKFKATSRLRFERFHSLITKTSGITGFNLKRQRAVTKKSTQCCVNYVLKPETSVLDCEPFIWNASCAFDQKLYDERSKKPSKEQAIIDYIMSKPWNWDYSKLLHESDESRILLASCGWAEKFHTRRAVSQPDRKIQHVIILYGASGTGKTTMAVEWDKRDGEEDRARYYRRNCDDGHFWGGGTTAYRGQRIIHFDEFTGQEKFNNLKEWTSKGQKGPPINVKGKGAELNHETVLFTSNTHPAGWYHNLWAKDPNQWKPFQRRITKVLFFPKYRPDGTDNDPADGTDQGYHYIDQTAEWGTFGNSYELALEHASAHWPIPGKEEQDAGGAFAPDFHLPGVTDRPKRPGDIYRMSEHNKRPKY